VNWIRIGKDGTSRNSAIRDVLLTREEQGYVLDIALANYGEQRAQNQLLSLYQNNELILQQPFELESQSEAWVRFPVPEPATGSGVSSTTQTGTSQPARSGATAIPSTRTHTRTQTRNYPVVQLELRIEGDEITFDDRTYWTIEFPRSRRILLVNQDNPSGSGLQSYLDAVLQTGAEADQLYEVMSVPVSALTADQFQGMDAVVLNGVPDLPDYLVQPLTDHVQQGAGVLLLPSAEGNPQGYNRLIGSAPGTGYQGVLGRYGSFQAVERLASPSEGHPILDGIFVKEENEPIQLDPPSIYFYFDIPSERNRSVIPILKTRSGKTLLAEVAIGNGSLIYSAIGADPGWSDFPLKPFFAPLFHKTVQYLSAGEGAKINQHHLGTPFRTEIADGSPTDTELLYNEQVIRPDLRQTFTGVMVRYDGLEWTPGFGSIRSGDREVYFSINQSAMESDLASLSTSDTEELLGTQFETVTVASSEDLLQSGTGIASLASFGKDLWHWFILLAIGFLLRNRWYRDIIKQSLRPADPQTTDTPMETLFFLLLALFTLGATLLAVYSAGNSIRMRNVRLQWKSGKLAGYPLFSTLFLAVSVIGLAVVIHLEMESMYTTFGCYTWVALAWWISSYVASKNYITDYGIVKNSNDPSQTIAWHQISDFVEKPESRGSTFLFLYKDSGTGELTRLELNVPDRNVPKFEKLLALKIGKSLAAVSDTTVSYRPTNR